MKTIINKLFILTLVAVGFTSCEKSTDELLEENAAVELTIQEKVSELESDEWLLKGFEESVMYTFDNGVRKTYYATNGDFTEPIPNGAEYSITEDLFTMDFHFGNIGNYELKISCDSNIIEFFVDGELHSTLFRRGSDYQDCL